MTLNDRLHRERAERMASRFAARYARTHRYADAARLAAWSAEAGRWARREDAVDEEVECQ